MIQIIGIVFWMNVQAGYDLSKAKAETDYSGVPVRAA